MVNGSCGQRKGNTDCDRTRLAVFKALGHGTEGKYFSLRHSLISGLAITKNAGKLRYLGYPAAIRLFLTLDAEIHD
jgi:hypothetical protein